MNLHPFIETVALANDYDAALCRCLSGRIGNLDAAWGMILALAPFNTAVEAPKKESPAPPPGPTDMGNELREAEMRAAARTRSARAP